MPRIEYAEYDKLYSAEDRRRQLIEAYNTIRNYEALRAMALEYVDQVLRYKYQGDTSMELRSWLEQNHNIPNTREARWLADLVIRQVIFNSDVDTRQLISSSADTVFGEYEFRHRNPMMTLEQYQRS